MRAGGHEWSLRASQRGQLMWRRITETAQLNYVGLAVAFLFFGLSLTPSLLPRGWMFQGLISGLNAAMGYGVGCVLEWVFRRFVRPNIKIADPPAWVIVAAKVVTVVAGVVFVTAMLIASAHWQREISELMGRPGTTTPAYFRIAALCAAVFVLVVAIFRSLRALVRWFARLLNRRFKIPRMLAPATGIVVLVVVATTLFTGVLAKGFFALANSAFSVRNGITSPAAVQPTDPNRSGSPASHAGWDTLGSEGRWFVSTGLDGNMIGLATGAPAKDPIRVYSGLESADGMQAQADLLVAELDRTHAWDRKVLMLVTTTGTGWVNSTSANAIELMYRGDTAVAATQYSYLPSVLSFLADREKVAEASRIVFETVHKAWESHPAAQRPKLLLYGESLGSQGSEAPFAGLGQLREQVDGALWVGPPNSNRMWSQFVARRDPGTREVAPVYADGLSVRFAAQAPDLAVPDSMWLNPRIVYLMHASDPIIWWSPDLIFNEPDWLKERRGEDVLPAMSWYPAVTFWQVAVDLAHATSVAQGHGHRYGTLVLDALGVILPPPNDWNPQRLESVRAVLEQLDDDEADAK